MQIIVYYVQTIIYNMKHNQVKRENNHMKYYIYHNRKDTPHCLLSICNSEESAKRWISRFNPQIYENKTMEKECLDIRKVK